MFTKHAWFWLLGCLVRVWFTLLMCLPSDTVQPELQHWSLINIYIPRKNKTKGTPKPKHIYAQSMAPFCTYVRLNLLSTALLLSLILPSSLHAPTRLQKPAHTNLKYFAWKMWAQRLLNYRNQPTLIWGSFPKKICVDIEKGIGGRDKGRALQLL